MGNAGKCCVLIPYYNAGDSLLETIHSVEAGSLAPDVIVVDDGSRVERKAVNILEKYSGALKIRLIELDENQGIEHALNRGLIDLGTSYKYVARLDCGDRCKNDRLRKQVEFLDSHMDYHLVGSWVDFVDLEGKLLYTLKHPSDFASIKKMMFLNPTFTHPAVMFRSSLLATSGLYPVDKPAAEDYAFFFKIIQNHKASNLNESLVDCLISPAGISNMRRRIQIKSRIKIILENFEVNPYAFYGLIRSILLFCTPRGFTVTLRRAMRKLQ
ncbi:glycosyltransferase [Cupriavidus sp. 2TAF22]|uniref:glycosyltransferase n=1 Tax=unclassified Cupriavidus TaxID=2640874 RepID=UPI003F8E31DC